LAEQQVVGLLAPASLHARSAGRFRLTDFRLEGF
jgi:hypothetical protein